MYAIYGNIYHQYTPNVSIYIYHTWILWVGIMAEVKIFPVEIPQWIHPSDQLANISNHNRLVLSESVILESPSWNMHTKISQKIGESQKLKPLFTGNHGFSRKYNWLVVWTPLKNMKVSWDYYSQYNIYIYMENKKCSKPPTSGFLGENHPCSAHMGHRLSDPTTMSSLYGCWVLVGSGCAWATTLRPKYDSLRMVGVWGGLFTISSWGHAFFWEENNTSQRSEIVG